MKWPSSDSNQRPKLVAIRGWNFHYASVEECKAWVKAARHPRQALDLIDAFPC